MTQDTSNLNRTQALHARPVAVPVVHRDAQPNGGQRITIRATPGKWQRMLLRASAPIERQFDLDAYGVRVLELCDGQRTVSQVIDDFAHAQRLDSQEAELSVLPFLRMLISKGLIHMFVPNADSTEIETGDAPSD